MKSPPLSGGLIFILIGTISRLLFVDVHDSPCYNALKILRRFIMAIGLNSNELLMAFIQNLAKHKKAMDIELMTAEIGINPQTKELLDSFKKEYPNFTAKQLLDALCVIASFMDVIAFNNETLSKSISHVDR
jgi:hypothetical protein